MIIMKISTKTLTRTAVMLAVTLVFQALRFLPFIAAMPNNSYIIGTLVNLALILSVTEVGIGPAVLISIVTPVVAFMQGHIKFPLLVPMVALGNIILCYLFYYVQKINKYAAVAIGAVVKWIFLYYASKFVLGMFLKLPQPQFDIMVAGFNIPQLITALLGGFLAVIMTQIIRSSTKKY